MSYLKTANSDIYKEALQVTEDLNSPAEGFVKTKEETVVKTTQRLQKQSNTAIAILVRIYEEVEKQAESVKRIEAILKEKAPPTGEVIEGAIQELQKKLEDLKLGEGTSKTRPVKERGKYYVFKNPQEIFNKEKGKLKK